MKPLELTGRRFGRLVAQKYVGNRKTLRLWQCVCDCGNVHVTSGANLIKGHTKSCGCLKRERDVKFSKTHGLRKSPEYRVWASMKQRCNNKNEKSYANYGMRGISVCRRWSKSFTNFLSDMGQRPSLDHSIDRINYNLGYSPGNCRWIPKSEQSNNRRNNVRVKHAGENLCLGQWSKRFKIHYQTLMGRYLRGERPPELFMPTRH